MTRSAPVIKIYNKEPVDWKIYYKKMSSNDEK